MGTNIPKSTMSPRELAEERINGVRQRAPNGPEDASVCVRIPVQE